MLYLIVFGFEKWKKTTYLEWADITPPPSPRSDRVKIAFCSILLFETKEQNYILLFETKEQNYILLFCCLTKKPIFC